MSWWFTVFVGILSVTWQANCSRENEKYDNYTLVQITPNTEAQMKAMLQFSDPSEDVEVLKWSRDLNDSMDLLVPPSQMEHVYDFTKGRNLSLEVKNAHYGRSFELLERMPRRRVNRQFDVFRYNSYDIIEEELMAIAKAHPDLVTLETLGMSYQGRRMRLLKISTDPNGNNPAIFIDAGIHAREWVAPAMAMYIIHRLTTDQNARMHELRNVDWLILPVVNPDGYEYSRSSRGNRLWRKTRSQTSQDCYGVDGNRNYGFKWAVSGVSNNPCDRETYAGAKPFSEPETQLVRNVMKQNSNIKLYVSLHAYGQYLVYPWGYTGDYLPKEWKKLDRLARLVSAAVENAGGEPFKVMSAGKWYPAAGGSDDFAFGAMGVPYSYTMELTNGFEFVFPERLLQNVLPQFYEGFKVFAAQIRKEFYY